MVLRSLKER